MPKTPNRRIFVRAAGMVLITGLSLGASATYAAADDGQNWNDQSQGQYSDNGSSNNNWSSDNNWNDDSNNNWNSDSNNNWSNDSNNNWNDDSNNNWSNDSNNNWSNDSNNNWNDDSNNNWNDDSNNNWNSDSNNNWNSDSNNNWNSDSNNNWNDDSNNNWSNDSNNNWSAPENKQGTTSADTSGAAVEQGLQPNALRVLNAVQKEFPEITDIGGVRADALADHPSGRALDLMIPNYSTPEGKAKADKIATYLQDHADELGIQYIISQQTIWNVERDGEGWRSMSNRGGDSANHLDHVHVTVYPSDG